MGLTMRMTYSIYLLYSNSSKLSHVFHSVWTILLPNSMEREKENRVSKILFLTIDFLKENIYNFSIEFVYNLRAAYITGAKEGGE